MTRWVGVHGRPPTGAHPDPAGSPAPTAHDDSRTATITTLHHRQTTPTRLRSRIGVAAFLTAGGLLALAGVPAAAADEPPAWSVSTAANDYGSDRDNFEYTVNAGDTVDDGIVVANPGTETLDVSVYAADAFTTDTGALDVRTQDDAATDVGAWLQPGVDHVSLAPGASADVPFRITVPTDAQAGDHVGGIVTARTVTSGGQQVEQRVALRVHLHVAGFFRPGLQVEDLRTSYSGPAAGTGDATVSYTLHNTGNAILSVRQDIAVGGPFGAFAAHADALDVSPALLPGESWRVSVPVHGVARTGWLQTTVTLTPLFTDPAGSTSELDPVTAGTHAWAMSWLVALVSVVVLGLVGLLVWFVVRLLRRPRRANATAVPDEATADAPGDEPESQPETSLSANRAHAASPNTTA